MKSQWINRKQRDAIRALRRAAIEAEKVGAFKFVTATPNVFLAELDALVNVFETAWMRAPGPDLVALGEAASDWNKRVIYFGGRALKYKKGSAIAKYNATVWRYFDSIDQFHAVAKEIAK